ncbi:hypothetical protein BGW80DRAFT_1442860 [Lactifluus volemus]|nr:hypothetical protein BGW80DRAFT_1442860 [Lactifluus volemus]
MTEIGRRMLINIILLHVTSTVPDKKQTVYIVPEFLVEATFESDDYSFNGVIDYLLVRLAPERSLTGAVIRAEQDNTEQAIPRAALTVASYCKEQQLSVMRGCITSGEQWTFFVYKSPTASGRHRRVARIKRGGEFHFSRQFNLGENLSLVLGLLSNLTNNALEHDQKYFSYEK